MRPGYDTVVVTVRLLFEVTESSCDAFAANWFATVPGDANVTSMLTGTDAFFASDATVHFTVVVVVAHEPPWIDTAPIVTPAGRV